MTNHSVSGNLASFDVATVVVPIEHGARRLVLSCYVLDWNKQNCCWLDERATLEALLWRLELSFRRTGGVPDRLELRPVRPLAGPGLHEWSPPFQRFCKHFRTEPVPTKELRLDVLGAARCWLQSRQHESLGACQLGLDCNICSPEDVDVQKDLNPLPTAPFLMANELFRRVTGDGFVQFGGDIYSVPNEFTSKTVWIRCRDKQVSIRSQNGRLLATHQEGDGTGCVRLHLHHFRSRLALPRTTRPLRDAFLARFPQHNSFLLNLIAQRRQSAPAELRALLTLVACHPAKRVAAALEEAVHYNNYSHRFVAGVLALDDSQRCRTAPDPHLEQGELFTMP